MESLRSLIVSLGGSKVNNIKNTMTPSFLYRFENGLYITIEYDKRDHYKSVELGSLFLMRDSFPRLVILDDFEVLLKEARAIGLPVSYTIEYINLSYKQMVENVICNLKIVLENYALLHEKCKAEFSRKQRKLEKYLIKDVSTMSEKEIAKESSQIIYKPKADDIDYFKLTSWDKKAKEESDYLREQYNIPKNIYTYFEYHKLKERKENIWPRFVICFALQLVALVMFILGLTNAEKIDNSQLGYFIFTVILVALLGLSVIVKWKNGKNYLITPYLCYFVLFVFMDKIIETENELILALVTLIGGTLLSAYFLIVSVILPHKKQKKATAEFQTEFYKTHTNVSWVDYRDHLPLNLYLENGRYVSVFSYDENNHTIAVCGSIFYKKVKTTTVTIEQVEIICTYAEAIAKAIEMLQDNDKLFIFKD